MDSYLAVLGGPSPARTAHEAALVTARLAPTFGGPYETLSLDLGRAGAAWLRSPVDDGAAHAAVFGEQGPWVVVLLCSPRTTEAANTLAAAVLATWRFGGDSAVRELDDLFGGFVANRLTGQVVAVADALGQLAPRLRVERDRALLASHDLPLVAAGAPCEPDVASLVGAAILDWSPGGHGLLAGIRTVDPSSHLEWHPDSGLLEVAGSPAAELRDGECEPGEVLFGRLVSRMRDLAGNDVVTIDLTAGRDSRVVLAAGLAALPPSQIRTSSRGGRNSVDVSLARSIAARVGVRWERGVDVTPAATDITGTVDVMAWVTHGEWTTKRAVAGLPAPGLVAQRHLVGSGGEVFRHYYHQDVATRTDAIGALRSKLSHRLGFVAAAGADATDAFTARLDRVLATYDAEALQADDVFSLFYLRERYRRWAAVHPRASWTDAFASPFSSPALVRAALGGGCALSETGLHDAALATLPASVRRMPVNPAPQQLPTTTRLARKVGWGVGDVVDVRAEALSPHRAAMHEELREGIVGEVLGGAVVDDVIAGWQAGKPRAFAVAANLYTANRHLTTLSAARLPSSVGA